MMLRVQKYFAWMFSMKVDCFKSAPPGFSLHLAALAWTVSSSPLASFGATPLTPLRSANQVRQATGRHLRKSEITSQTQECVLALFPVF